MAGVAGERNSTEAVSRRRIITTGAKLAYAAPLLAATSRLSGQSVFAADYCEDCILDTLSPKAFDGGCYTCKVVEAGCARSPSGLLAVDLAADQRDELVCVCQGHPGSQSASKCVVNGVEYDPGAAISDGVCHPVNVAGDAAYDTCVAAVSTPR